MLLFPLHIVIYQGVLYNFSGERGLLVRKKIKTPLSRVMSIDYQIRRISVEVSVFNSSISFILE